MDGAHGRKLNEAEVLRRPKATSVPLTGLLSYDHTPNHLMPPSLDLLCMFTALRTVIHLHLHLQLCAFVSSTFGTTFLRSVDQGGRSNYPSDPNHHFAAMKRGWDLSIMSETGSQCPALMT